MPSRSSTSWPWLILLLLGLLALGAVGCTEHSPSPAPTSSLRLALALQPSSALAMIALDRGYFASNGLTVEVGEHPSGKRALHDSFFQGKSDIALSSDVPLAMAALNGQEFRIVATTFHAHNINRILARSTAGVRQPGDLRGKRIATQPASAVHYFLHLFLLEHGLKTTDVEITYLSAEELPEALASGKIDAYSMREPYISQGLKLLEGSHTLFQAPWLYHQFDAIVVSPQLLERDPQAVTRFLRALLEAERFTHDHPRQAVAIVSARLGVDAAVLEHSWSEIAMRIELPQSSLRLLENIARWALEQEGEQRKLPNMLPWFDSAPLLEIAPNAVTLIH